ncbi:MAG: Na+/H+ antiporter subunit E [Wenzhouxiangella sp.]
MRYVISLTLILAVLWLAVSGVYKPPILIFGAVSVTFVVWLSVRMNVVGVEHNPILFSWRLPVYWIWLVGQIIMANFNLLRRVIDPASIRPRLLRLSVPHHSAVAKVTYANSVTLTPGTISLMLSEKALVVHALDEVSAEGLMSGDMADHISWLEGDGSRNA